MPFYDLHCNKCEKDYNIMASMADKTNHQIPCPDCGSNELETVYAVAPAYVKNVGDSAPTCPNSAGCAGSGCHFAR